MPRLKSRVCSGRLVAFSERQERDAAASVPRWSLKRRRGILFGTRARFRKKQRFANPPFEILLVAGLIARMLP
jgi:hypothetical protein